MRLESVNSKVPIARRVSGSLRSSEERFRLLVESVQDYAIFMLDPSGNVVTWNVGAQRMKGYTADEIIGRSCEVFYPDDLVEAGRPGTELERAAVQSRSADEGWRLRKDGSRFWASVVITALRDEHGELHGYANVTRDLSEQRRLNELEHASQRMNEFLAMLAHELRNPLAPIRNAVSIMQMQNLTPALLRTSEIIDRQLGYLTRLVDDLLDVARIVTGKILLKRERIDYREVVLASVEAVRPLVAGRHQRLVLNLPEEPIEMLGDATRLVQSLQNLLNNAVRYTPDGGGIGLAVRIEGAACLTTVTDTGHGIAPEALGRIFELFAQENLPRLPSESGLGIGLSLARTLVEQHGGMLSAHSDGIGHGSTFTMRLPLRYRSANSLAPAAPVHEAGEVGEAAARSRRVLVVDDDRDTTDSMVYMLELLGHEAHGAYSAEQAVRAMSRIQPQLVMLDLNMPDGDGFSVIERLRAHSREPLYVVAMTGYGQKEDRRRTLEAGFQAHLTKPVGAEQLRQTLREVGTGIAR